MPLEDGRPTFEGWAPIQRLAPDVGLSTICTLGSAVWDVLPGDERRQTPEGGCIWYRPKGEGEDNDRYISMQHAVKLQYTVYGWLPRNGHGVLPASLKRVIHHADQSDPRVTPQIAVLVGDQGRSYRTKDAQQVAPRLKVPAFRNDARGWGVDAALVHARLDQVLQQGASDGAQLTEAMQLKRTFSCVGGSDEDSEQTRWLPPIGLASLGQSPKYSHPGSPLSPLAYQPVTDEPPVDLPPNPHPPSPVYTPPVTPE